MTDCKLFQIKYFSELCATCPIHEKFHGTAANLRVGDSNTDFLLAEKARQGEENVMDEALKEIFMILCNLLLTIIYRGMSRYSFLLLIFSNQEKKSS